MTKREAAIVSAYTGVMLGKFSDMHEYVEELIGPVWTHHLADKEIVARIKEASKQDFVELEVV